MTHKYCSSISYNCRNQKSLSQLKPLSYTKKFKDHDNVFCGCLFLTASFVGSRSEFNIIYWNQFEAHTNKRRGSILLYNCVDEWEILYSKNVVVCREILVDIASLQKFSKKRLHLCVNQEDLAEKNYHVFRVYALKATLLFS